MPVKTITQKDFLMFNPISSHPNYPSSSVSSQGCVSTQQSRAALNAVTINQPQSPLRNGGAINLTGFDLSRANLAEANLAGANLAGANLAGANMPGANMPGANMPGANMPGANMPGANMPGANF